MVNAENILEIIQRYFSDTAVVVLAVLALLFLLKDAEKKYKIYAVLLGAVALVVFNDFSYQIVMKIGEADTFYRFLWIFPTTIFCGYFLIEIWGYLTKRSQKSIYVLILVIVIFLNYKPSFHNWVNFPENVYQLPDEQIEVAKLLRKYKGKWRPKFFDDGTFSDGIREYDANIMVETEPTIEMALILENWMIDYQGTRIQEIMHEAQIDTVSVKKEHLLAQNLFESAGYKKIGETSVSYLYHYKWRNIEQRWEKLKAYYNDAILKINEEYIVVEGLENTYEVLYLTDMHIDLAENAYKNANGVSAAEQFVAWIEMANAYEVDAVLLGSNMLGAYTEENVVFLKDELEKLRMPYVYMDEHSEVAELCVNDIEVGEILLCGIEDSSSERILSLMESSKPVLLMSLKAFSEDENGRDALLKRESSVIEIVTGGAEKFNKNLLGNMILQYTGTPAYEGEGTLFTIRGE